MRLSNEDSTLSTLTFYKTSFSIEKMGFMYCIVYFVPAKYVDYHLRYVTQRFFIRSCLTKQDKRKGKSEMFLEMTNYPQASEIRLNSHGEYNVFFSERAWSGDCRFARIDSTQNLFWGALAHRPHWSFCIWCSWSIDSLTAYLIRFSSILLHFIITFYTEKKSL